MGGVKEIARPVAARRSANWFGETITAFRALDPLLEGVMLGSRVRTEGRGRDIWGRRPYGVAGLQGGVNLTRKAGRRPGRGLLSVYRQDSANVGNARPRAEGDPANAEQSDATVEGLSPALPRGLLFGCSIAAILWMALIAIAMVVLG